MRLNTLAWGSGPRTAVLIHGMLGSATQYHQLGPALAERGYRVIALDLPGHGDSPPAPDATMDLFVDAVVESVDHEPALAIGHSLGAIVLSHSLSQLRPARAVYVDVPLDSSRADPPPAGLRERFTTARAARTESRLRATRPRWSAEDCRVEAEAAAKFDVDTAVALQHSYTAQTVPAPTIPSLVVRAEPSRYVSTERARELEKMGFSVQAVRGAGHCVWYGFLDDFLGALDEWVEA
ncbi:alpha/beta hydrolase [Kribbella sp. NBC_00709]|uniref:alpha/beta fold hydrolase n=1 Tax=Kribbella sp. NBC_00709 TaxID=2975972 RepID=UPI002E2C3146|nr:alpha/beta hydrolase [Kribbella sp. NBC_00709]